MRMVGMRLWTKLWTCSVVLAAPLPMYGRR
jgi:hypothetical protein